MAAKKTPPPLDLPTVSNIAGTSDETRLNRQDVLGLLSRRKECSLREYLQFACDLPLRIEDASPCRPIIRYFAMYGIFFHVIFVRLQAILMGADCVAAKTCADGRQQPKSRAREAWTLARCNYRPAASVKILRSIHYYSSLQLHRL